MCEEQGALLARGTRGYRCLLKMLPENAKQIQRGWLPSAPPASVWEEAPRPRAVRSGGSSPHTPPPAPTLCSEAGEGTSAEKAFPGPQRGAGSHQARRGGGRGSGNEALARCRGDRDNSITVRPRSRTAVKGQVVGGCRGPIEYGSVQKIDGGLRVHDLEDLPQQRAQLLRSDLPWGQSWTFLGSLPATWLL